MAQGTGKIAISINDRLLSKIEKVRKTTGESRSALIRRAIVQLLREEAHAEKIDRYTAAYSDLPETLEDARAARAMAARTLASIDWSEE